MRLLDDVTQDSPTDATALMQRLDLYLAYFYGIRLVEQLDHTHAHSINLDD